VNDVRDRLLDAAEAVVAERGIGALSVREVQHRAGQRNNSAIAYHFGSRHGLLCALADRRLQPIDDVRRARLDALGATDDVRALVEVLVHPQAESIGAGAGTCWARFLAQTLADPMLSELVLQRPAAGAYREVLGRLQQLVGRTLPHPLPTVRTNHVVSLTIHRLADWESGRSIATRNEMAQDLVDVSVAMLTAPATASVSGG
jgi:AcrR family transcriptional regulator